MNDWGLNTETYNSEEKGCQRCKTQGRKEDREDLEERDSTTRQRLAISAQPFCNKVGFTQNRLTGNCPHTFHYFVGSVFSASSPFTTHACFLPAHGQQRWHVRSGPCLAISAQPFCNKVGFIQKRLTGNCPHTFYYFAGIGVAKVLTHFVSMLKTTSG